ncbi:MAG: hypothetical protein IPO87_04370 [Flavobacteriales bacterium]|nr:hypothetical protein [Flavobacteriales bacterium]
MFVGYLSSDGRLLDEGTRAMDESPSIRSELVTGLYFLRVFDDPDLHHALHQDRTMMKHLRLTSTFLLAFHGCLLMALTVDG